MSQKERKEETMNINNNNSDNKKTSKKTFMEQYGLIVLSGVFCIIFFICFEFVLPSSVQSSVAFGKYLATETILPDILSLILAPLNFAMEHPLVGIPTAIVILVALVHYNKKITEENKTLHGIMEFIAEILVLFIICTTFYHIRY